MGLLIRDIATPREDVLSGEVFGFIKLYNVFEKGLESSPEYIFSITYLSDEIRNVLQAVFQKLRGERTQGTFIFSGGYGTGKSHALLILYHLFKYWDKGLGWLKENGIDADLPRDSRVVLLPLMDLTVTYLWEPIFQELGRGELVKEVQQHPSTSLIKEALGNRTVVIIVDELEAWYGGLGDETVKNRNLNFLQNLTEISKEKDSKLLLFISLYGVNKELMGRISRVEPYFLNLATSRERANIVLFRLFKDVKREMVGGVVDDYVKLYRHVELEIGDPKEYRRRMIDCYPIHPELMDVLFERYSGSLNYQNTRGVLYLLSSIIRREYARKDMILASNVDAEGEEGELSQLDRELVEKCLTDIGRSRIRFGREILNTTLLYSLGEVKERGATRENMILGVLQPADNINDLYTSLSELKMSAWHLWEVNGRYLLKPEENILVVIQSEARRIIGEGKMEQALEKIKETIKRDKGFYVHPIEEVPEDKRIKIVVSLKDLTQGEIEEFYRGREYRNTIILVEPKRRMDLRSEVDLLNIAQRIVISEERKEEVKEEVRKLVFELLKKDKIELMNRLDEIYGNWIKFIQTEKGIEGRRITCELREIRARGRESYDVETIKSEITESLDGKEKGVEVKDLMEDFYVILGKPLIFERSTVDRAIMERLKEGKVVVEKGGKVYDEKNLPPRIEDSMILRLKEYYKPPPEIIEEEKIEERIRVTPLWEEKIPPTPEKELEFGVKPPQPPLTVEVKPTVDLETGTYRTPYRLAGELERKLLEDDVIKSVDMTIEAKLSSVEELAKFVEQLKAGKAKFGLKLDVSLEGVYSKSDLLRLMDQLPIPEEGGMKAKLKVERK